jgi:hypothetical protein
MKRLSFGGRNLDVRMDVINVFNRSGLGDPQLDLARADFGKIFGPRHGARQIQLSARATF